MSLIHLTVNHIRNILNNDYAIQDQEKLLINIDHRLDIDNQYRLKKIYFLREQRKEQNVRLEMKIILPEKSLQIVSGQPE